MLETRCREKVKVELNMEPKSDKRDEDDKAESSGSSNEVTAEWIVRAQLKISQPKKKAASFGTADCGAHRSTGSPCRVVYKWNSDVKSQEQASKTRQNVKNNSEKVRIVHAGSRVVRPRTY